MLKRLEHSSVPESSRPEPGPQFEFRVTEAARRLFGDVLENSVTESAVLNAVTDVVGLAEESAEERKETEPPDPPIACRAGCAYCCYPRVHVTPPEVIFLAHFIRAKFSSSELEGLKTRLKEADEITHGMTEEEHGGAGVPCPLLVDNLCSAYDARPLECRGFTSMDADACRRALDHYASWNVPVYFPQYSIFKNAHAGLLAALIGADYPFEVLELTAALRIALNSPDVAERWLAGENVFQAAALSPSDPDVLALQPWTPTFEPPTKEEAAR